MFNKFYAIFLLYLLVLTSFTIASPFKNYESFNENKIRMTPTDMPHQPAVPPSLDKEIIQPTQSLLEISKKSSTLQPQNIQTQLLSFV
uniref:Uncharacterized protein n=1 Tax=Strongyloides stercoralis TaxID=6248 RepID=A0A0K0DVU5_STRER